MHLRQWIWWSLLVFLLVIFLCSGYLYTLVINEKTDDYPRVETIVYEKTPINSIQSIERFHSETSYYVIWGQSEDADSLIAFIPMDNYDAEQDITVISEDNIISKTDLQQAWQKDCDHCQWKKATLGVVDDEVVWEITYRDESDRYVFEYVSIVDGSTYEIFRLTQMFR